MLTKEDLEEEQWSGGDVARTFFFGLITSRNG